MKYYKIINDKNFVGVGTTNELRRWQKKHNIFLSCEENEAQYIECENVLYHAIWMVPETSTESKYITLEVKEIDKEEYDALYKAAETGAEIPPEEDEEVVDEPVIDLIEEVTVEYMIQTKTAEMSSTCNKLISAGFDVVLSDEQTHHFSLSTQDQLNLITLSTMVAAGEENIPYHADGELCQWFGTTDIQKIIEAATSFKTYHTSYFNSLKMYISALKDIQEIQAVTYGSYIPEEYQSDVLKALFEKIV